MDTATAMPEVKGVPSGLTAEPLSFPTGEIKGVPEGLVAEPLTGGAVKQQIAAVPKLDPFRSSKLQEIPPGLAESQTMATANPKGLAMAGNLPIWNRPTVQNADGTHSSEYSTSFKDEDGGGYEVLVPTVVNGKFLTADGKKPKEGSPEEKAMFKAAWQHYRTTGEHLGKFDNSSNADAYSHTLHSRGDRKQPQQEVKGVPPGVTPHPVNVLRAYHPSAWQNLTRSFGETQTGQTVEGNLDQLGRMMKRFREEANNPVGMTDAEWAEHQKDQTAFLERHLGKNAVAGAATGAAEFGEEMMSPSQIALMAATMGESGLVQAAQKVGVPGLATAAKTVSKLAQVQFASQMIEGTATATENAFKSLWNRDWEGAGKSAVEGMASGLMARGIVSHEVASERVHRDLDATAQQTQGKTFDQLNPYDQGIVIDQTVKQSPEYQEVLKQADEQQAKGKKDTVKQRQQKLSHYYDAAVSKAWNPDAAARAMDGLQRASEEDERHQSIQDVVKTIKVSADARAKAIHDEQEAVRQAGIEERPERRQAAATARSERQKLADAVKDKREEVYATRQEAQQQPAEVAQRDVEAVQGEDGAITYPANYWGEENSFGVTGDVMGHGIFRQTPRGFEFLDTNGNFSEAPEEPFIASDPAAADTIARLSSLSATADTLADSDSATAEQKADAEKLASIRRDLVSGEIDTREAQRQAGIAEKVTLSDEFTAARDGELTGPFHDSSAGEYQSKLESSVREAADSGASGWEEDDIKAVLDQSMALARQQTENNLNHVYRPGDHIVSKRGVKWTLDAKGMLHPHDGGPPLPLMRNGFYSNHAIQLAESGRIGYGTETREERKIAAAKRRTVEQSIRESQAEVAREMRLSQQAEGLQLAGGEEPRGDIEGKQERERRRMSRPPRAPESPESQIVRMIFQAPSNANSVINGIARAKETTPEEVMRLSLATDPAMSGTPEQKIAGLEPGDRIVEPIRKRPWVVEQGKDGQTYLRSGNAQPLKLDRLNPSDAVKGIIGRGEIEKDQLPTDPEKVAFENPHYVRWQEDQVADVEAQAKKPAPKPVTEKQADVQVQVAERRATAAISVATKKTIDALEPKTTSLEKAVDDVAKAQEAVKAAETAYGQAVEAKGRTEPQDVFPQKAPISIGLRGESGTMVQNSREVPFHYELVPIDALVTSHEWNGKKLIENPSYPSALQPRTISESEAGQNALRAERGKYDFRQYADKTINGSMGPAIIDEGGQVVGGNTRLAILRKHLSNLEATGDVEERQAVMAGMKARMRQLALDSGIARYPEDGKMYVVTRMMDRPIESTREAAELGRLFNKKVGVEINKAAKGVSYSKALDDDVLREIGRLVDAHDGIAAAIQSEPDFFNKIVTDRFDVGPEEEADWFREVGSDDLKQKVLSEDGRNQFVKAMLGTVVKDASVLNKLQGKTPYIALERALAHIVRMRGMPHLDITGKIIEAMQAAADTDGTDPGLSQHSDGWHATYNPDQQDFLGMEAAIPPEPDRMVEALWRAMQAGNRTLNDRLKSYIGEESSAAMSMFAAQQESPAESFNRAFRKELRGSAELRGGASELTPEQFQAALENLPLDDVQAADSDTKEVTENKPEQAGAGGVAAPPNALDLIEDLKKNPRTPSAEEEAVLAKHILNGGRGGITRPPAAPDALAEAKAQKGYVTPNELKAFLETNPATKKNAPELLRTAKLMAEYVYDADPPVGTDRKEALDWVLRERLAGIESGELKGPRGQYVDPNLEAGFASGIMRLHKAADASTFIHEFAHVIFPLLSDDDLRTMNRIIGDAHKYPVEWDGQRSTLKGQAYVTVSEKFAHGLEQFLRDENPTGFTHEVKAVLAKVKEIMRKIYLAAKGDPLSDFHVGEAQREVFAKMFGITDFDVADDWREEVKKARAEEKRMKMPSEDKHPLVKMASEMGADGIRNALKGKVEDEIGNRVDPRGNPITFIYGKEDRAMIAWTAVQATGSRITDAQLIRGDDGEWGIRFDAKTKVPPDVLMQGALERHPGVELQELEKRLNETPPHKMMERKLLQLRMDNLRNRIRAERGVEEAAPRQEPGLAKAVAEEVKSGRADSARKANDGVSRVQKPGGLRGIPKPSVLRMPGDAGARERGEPAGRSVAGVTSLAEVKPVNLVPLERQRAAAVGTVKGQPFDAKKWEAGIKAAMLPENAPPPTYALDPRTAQILKFPGQKQIVQMTMSALEQGDGFITASTTGTGKCLGRGTLVMLADGSIVKVEDVRVGDQLMGPDSCPRTVLSLARGRDQMYRIIPTKGKSYVVNEPHILSLVMTPTGTKHPGGQKQIVNISVADYLKQNNTFKHRAKGYRVGVSFPRRRVPMDPYILGMWLGDGTSSRPSVTTEDPEIEGFWEEHVQSKGGWIRRDTTGERCPSYTAVFSKRGSKVRRNVVWDEIGDMGLVGNKHIPHLYKANDEQTRLKIMAGLIDTDGSLSGGGYDFISKWERLAEDVAYVARSLGLAAYVQPCRKTCGNNGKTGTYYRVFISGDVGRIPVRINRKKAAKRQQKKDVLVTGIKVEPVGRGEYFGFEIDGDHLFLLGDFTVTHNTYTAMGTAWEFRSQRPDAKILHITKNRGLLKDAVKVAANSFGMEVDKDVPETPGVEAGIYGTTYMGLLNNKIYSQIKWDLVLTDESGEARNWFRDENKQGKRLIDVVNNAEKAVYYSATPFHSPMEYGYLTKLNLWPKGQFDKWIEQNFAHEKIGDKVVARLDPSKQAKLRQQLIERGQLVSQGISYEGYNAHFGVVPVTDEVKRGLDRIREGFARARDQFVKMGKKGMAEKTAAFEATYTKAFMERSRIPQAIEVAKRARAQGWQVMFFSETSAEDLFRRPRGEDIEPSTYQQLDDAMGGTLSKIIPTFEDVYERLREEFGGDIVDYSGRGNTMASRDAAKQDFLTGKAPMLYTTFAAGGIGTSFHDADYPELNIKGGERPRVQINLGPPYSGVLLEQALGRPWRFGVKSDVHAVFLASDAAPDIHLMQTKVGPRMRALRAAVHGENDSLANAMQTYTDDQKVRERQDMLAYSEGDEQKISAGSFQVQPKGRNVGINEWSQINFPSAEDAKNKGMKYGENVAEGGDWSSLFQSKFGLQPPDSPENMVGKKEIDRLANKAITDKDSPVGGMEPADRDMATAVSAANATAEVDVPADRDKDNTARQSMLSNLRDGALIPYQGLVLTQEQGMVNIARMDGKAEVGYDLRRMNRSYRTDWDVQVAQSWNMLEDSMERNKLKPDDAAMRQVWDVVEGKRVSDDPAIMAVAADISDMMGIVHDDLATAGVHVRTKTGDKIPYKDFPRDPHYMPHRVDYDYEMVDPETKERVKVRDFLKIDEKRQQRILDSIPELRPYSRQQILDYLRRNDPRAPAQGNIHYAREVNFPFIKKDYGTLVGYFDQAAQAMSAAKNFGPEEEHLNGAIKKISNPNGRETLNSMFRASLHPQNWEGVTAKIYNAAVAYEAASKMTFSALKVPYHLVLGPVALKGRVMPHIRAFSRLALHPKEVMENAAYVGTIARQSSASDMLFGEHMNNPVRQILRREMFESAYKMVRVISGESARVYLDQYAMRDLKVGGAKAEHTRRMLKDVFLIGDHGIDEAIRNGKFSQEDMAKGQTAFTNLAAFSGSGDPLQMPGMARLEMPRTQATPNTAVARAIRLTYALQSFSVKAMSLLREHLYDEVMVHGNKKPLMYAIIAFPIVGTMLNATGTGGKHIVQRGLEGAMGKKHKEDSWDKYFATLKDDVEHPEAAKILKWYVDSWALSAGMELLKTLGDPLLNIANGKPAKADDYWLQDMAEHVAGPFFSDLWKTLEEVQNLHKIQEGQKHPEMKGQKMRKSLLKYGTEEIPALREIPQIDEEIGKPAAKPKTFSY